MKPIIIIATVCFGAFAQDIWVSKDSIRVPGERPGGWVVDTLTLKNLGSTPVWLDSAKLDVDSINSGIGTLLNIENLDLEWAEYDAGTLVLSPFWNLKSTGAGDYLLTASSGTSTRKPLSMDGQGDSISIRYMEIGSCFWCDLVKYPAYLRGTLKLFFNNGQILSLKVRCYDSRTHLCDLKVSVRQRAAVHGQHQPCLANGQRLAKEWILLDRKRIRQVIY